MKKITLFIFLLSLMVGMQQAAAQTIVQDFEAGGLAGIFGGASAALAPNPSGTGQVAMLSSNTGVGTQPWQGTNISLTQNVRLTTDKTMSMDVYSTTPITIAPKVIGGLAGAPDSTTRAQHTGTGWETLTFTFDLALDGSSVANGDYSAFVIYYNWNTAANTFGTQDSRVFYVDNIKGIAVAPPVEVVPTVAAPTPPNRLAADVKSIFSNAYAPVTAFNYAGVDNQPSNDNTYNTSWCPGQTTLVQVAGNDTNKVTGLGSGLATGCEGISFLAGRFDATAFTHLHMDIWTETATLDKVFNVKFSNWDNRPTGPEANAIEFNINNSNYLPNPNPGTWISMDIPVPAGLKNDFVQFVITSSLGTVYYDNIYLYKGTALGTANFEKSNIKMYPNPVKNTLTIDANATINKVSIYNVLGQEVLTASPKSNSATLQTSELQRGVYMVRTDIDGNTSTSKFLKE